MQLRQVVEGLASRLGALSIPWTRRVKAVVGICITCVLFLLTGWYPHEDTHSRHSADRTTRSSWIRRGVDLSDPEAPFIRWPLARVCEETRWIPGLVFICDNNSGGIGNIRNYILTCIRYGIEAGATGLVMPQIESRSEQNLANLFRGYKPFDYFFDTNHFRRELTGSCPQITLYNDVESIPHANGTKVEKITPRDYGLRGGCSPKDLNRHSDLFGLRFHGWLSETQNLFAIPPVNTRHPRLIRFNWGVQWDYPVWKDGPEFANTFGGLLVFRRDILQLGKQVNQAMRQFTASYDRRRRFIGMHLRTENDILKFWTTYDTQSAAYIRAMMRGGFRAAYLATGNSTEAEKFKMLAARHNLQVVTKHDLIKSRPESAKLLKSLTWDQQALIDFIVLLYSDFFVGVSPSSFSINIAGKRHLKMEGIYARPWKVGKEGDGRSNLVGQYKSYWEDWLFMFDSLWP